jgi:hypothetical protein
MAFVSGAGAEFQHDDIQLQYQHHELSFVLDNFGLWEDV